jgi:hypothetical protein
MYAFYASIDQRDNPELRGKSVIVAWKAKRSVVCCFARRKGFWSALGHAGSAGGTLVSWRSLCASRFHTLPRGLAYQMNLPGSHYAT